MQRVRIGLTGLAFVFVLVLLAAVFSSPSSEERITANMIEQGRTAGGADVNASTPKEPLAELGLAPGNVDSNEATPGSAAPPGQ